MKLAVEAFAKVNRSLVVRGRRADGYHELETDFQTIDLTDRVTFARTDSDRIELATDARGLSTSGDNLVLRAAKALRERFRVSLGAAIFLSKKIPVGAGLGGGSSNAAATLRGLAVLWSLSLTTDELQPLAEALGSDVAFFLHGGRARGTGRGERITPLPDRSPEAVVLLSPPISLSTAAVYGALFTAPARDPGVPPADPGGTDPDRNDLEPAAESLHPELRRLREALRDAGARQARLSGSGSTVFGVFGSMEPALEAAARLSGKFGETQIRVVPTVSREEFLRRSRPAGVE